MLRVKIEDEGTGVAEDKVRGPVADAGLGGRVRVRRVNRNGADRCVMSQRYGDCCIHVCR